MINTINMIEGSVATHEVAEQYSNYSKSKKIKMVCEFNHEIVKVDLPVRLLSGLTFSQREATFKNHSLLKRKNDKYVKDMTKNGFLLTRFSRKRIRVDCIACNTTSMHNLGLNNQPVEINSMLHSSCPISEGKLSAEFCLSRTLNRSCRSSEVSAVSTSRVLEYLEHYISDAEKKILSDIANDQTYEDKFIALNSEGPASSTYMNIDTYRVIYWAFKNNKLSDMQFLERHHWLSVSLMYHPYRSLYKQDVAQHVKSFEIQHQSKKNETIGWHNLNEAIYEILFRPCDELRAVIEHGIDNMLLTTTRESPRLVNLLYINCFFAKSRIVPYMSICINNEDTIKCEVHLTICSFYNVYNAIQNKNSDENIQMKPTFGYGNWNDLLKLRKKEMHPIALKFPDVKSLETSDNSWTGNQSYIHDWYHCVILNNLGFKQRKLLLQVNDYFISPLLEYTKFRIAENRAKENSDNENLKSQPSYTDFLDKINQLSDNIPCEIIPCHVDRCIYNYNHFFCDDSNSNWYDELKIARVELIDQGVYSAKYDLYSYKIIKGALRGILQGEYTIEADRNMFFSVNLILWRAMKDEKLEWVFSWLKDFLLGESLINHTIVPTISSELLDYL
ncbi:MAG: hypothetical protein KAG53_11755, partial [Endozoicomonadaceae bacterium]|nr:hypothetical protein [Endozoicomonadaceae bacterium]